MRRAWKLLWREWRENRWFLYAGLLLVLVWPLSSSFQSFSWYADPRQARIGEVAGVTCGAVMALGGLLAVIVGVAAGCRDMRGRVSDFWLSRPVGLWSWLSARYLSGLATVLATATIPLMAALTLRLAQLTADDPIKYKYVGEILTCALLHGALLAVIYSLAMLLGLLVRRPSHAAILAIAAGLLVYFLPVLVPPLGIMNFWTFVENYDSVPAVVIPVKVPGMARWTSAQVQASLGNHKGFEVAGWYFGLTPEGLKFMALATAAIVAAAGAVFLAAWRGWRVRMDQKLMVWSLGGVTLILVTSLAFQLGSNLDAQLRTKVQPPGVDGWREVYDILAAGDRGVLLLQHPGASESPRYTTVYSAATFDISGGQLKLGPEIDLGDGQAWYSGRREVTTVVWSPKRPDRLYQLLRRYEKQEYRYGDGQKYWADGKCLEMSLRTLALDSDPPGRLVHTLDLLPHGEEVYSFGPAMLMNDRIYVCGNISRPKHQFVKLCHVIDLADPDEPQTVATLESPVADWVVGGDMNTPWRHALPELPGLSPRERFAVVFGLQDRTGYPAAWEGDLLVTADRQLKTVLTRRVTFEGNAVSIEALGERRPTPLESCLGQLRNYGVLRGNYYYATSHSLSSGVSVFDVSDPLRPRRVAFYAGGYGGMLPMAVLDDGRILLGGTELHVIEP
ncbi:MAG: hypothetical protein JXL80_09570, partial [Planctomycetes bacterium]|nr:hypothetical protein [Planctomycetota bacterium]